MNKRYQVFLSSTFADLEDERKEVMAALQKAGYFVVGMELFPSDDDESWEVIRRVIDQSDYYVLVVGGRYGTIGKDDKSFTEMEYDYAKDKGLPVLAFLHKNPADLPNKHVEKVHTDKLANFRKKIDGLHHRRSWSTKYDLATEVLASISQVVNLRPRDGWVRGEVAKNNEILREKLEEIRAEHQKTREERDRLADQLSKLGAEDRKQMIAWGDDAVELSLHAREKGSKGETSEVVFTTQWNRIFDLISPNLIVWCSTYNATRELVSMLENEATRHASNTTERTFHGLTDGSLDTIRNQLLALELIKVETDETGTRFTDNELFSCVTERWRLSDRGLREHSQKHAQRRDI